MGRSKRKTLFKIHASGAAPMIEADSAPLSPASAHRQLVVSFSQSSYRQSDDQPYKKRKIDESQYDYQDEDDEDEQEDGDEEEDENEEEKSFDQNEQSEDESDDDDNDDLPADQPLDQSIDQQTEEQSDEEIDELAAAENDKDDADLLDDEPEQSNNQTVSQPIKSIKFIEDDSTEIDPNQSIKLREPKTLSKIAPLPTLKEQIFVANLPSLTQSIDQSTEQILGIPPSDQPLNLIDCSIKAKVAKQFFKNMAPKLSKAYNKSTKKQSVTQSSKLLNQSIGEFAHPLVRSLYPLLASYKDVIFPSMTPGSHSIIRSTFCLHALNHAINHRNQVIKHNQSLNQYIKRTSEQSEQAREALSKLSNKERKQIMKSKQSINQTINQSTNQEPAPEFRDQGFTRCTVLILVPYAHSAYQVINQILSLLPESMIVANKERFNRELGPGDAEVDPSKPPSYRHIFEGSLNDAVRIGISLSATQVKLYSSFYAADIIVASPLGLRMIVGSEGDAPHSRDWDFLSSVELLIVDQSDVIAHQNWSHLTHLFDYINKLPSQQKNQSSLADIDRIRPDVLNGLARHDRQTMAFAYELHHDLYALARSAHLCNKRGLVMFRPTIQHGALAQTNQQSINQTTNQTIKQAFHRIPCRSLTSAADDRFTFFIESVWPRLYRERSELGGCCIFVSHYFDFLKLRNWLRSKHHSFAALSEYSSNADLSRHRANFFHGRRKFLLITERLQYFRRYRIRGCHLVCFYSLPETSELYSDMVNNMEPTSDAQSTHVLALFNKLDAIQVEHIVGTQRANKLLTGDKDTHLFA